MQMGLALALSETERIGEEPPVARLACFLPTAISDSFDSDEDKNPLDRLRMDLRRSSCGSYQKGLLICVKCQTSED